MYTYVKEQCPQSVKCYLFIDEIQEILHFEKAIRSLFAEGMYDIYCTGSNSHMMSGELATYLSGRYIEIEAHSLTYIEFLEFHHFENSMALQNAGLHDPLTVKGLFTAKKSLKFFRVNQKSW